MNIELTIAVRVGPNSTLLHHELREVPKPERRNRVLREMLAEVGEKFLDEGAPEAKAEG